MAASDAKPVPQKNVAYRITFPILDADGDLVTGATGLDSEVSKDGGTFADCTNEATEIATSSGVYYLDLTSTEMNADTVAIIVKTSSSGAKTTTIVLYPEEAGDIRVNVTAFGGTAGTFSSGRPEVNTTHWGGTAVASTTVRADLINIAGAAVSTSTAQLGVNVVNAAGTAWGSGAITAASIATGAITSAKFAAGAIDAAAIANGAIDAATFAADVDAEILSYLVDDATRIDASALNTATGTTIPTNLDAAVSTRATPTQVNTEVDTALADIHLDHLLAVTYDPATKPGAADALLNELVESDAGVARFTANALEQAPTGGSAPTAAQIADAVWDEAQADHVSAGSFGVIASEIADILTDTADIQPKIGTPTDFGSGTSTLAANLQDLADNGTATYDRATDSLQALRDRGDAAWVTATGFSTHSAADVWSVGTRVLTAGTNIVLAKGVGVTGFNDLSAAQVNAEADTALADYDPPTNAEMEARTLLAAGYATPTNITTVGAVSGAVASVTGAVGSVTGNVGGNVAGSVGSVLGGINTTGGTITTLDALDTAQDSQHATTQGLVTTADTVVDAIKVKTDQLTFGVANTVNANITYVNETAVGGTGATGDEWGPA